MSRKSIVLPVLEPNLQISFYYRLQAIRELYLRESMSNTVKDVDITTLDKQLSQLVPLKLLSRLASFGLRGETFFPIPALLEANPFLLGYYRLLYGLSQKEFYNKGPFGRFKRLEDRGEIPNRLKSEVQEICKSLIKTAKILVEGIDVLSLDIIHDLQLLTIGPQLRGSENTKLGQDATKEFFSLIKNIVGPYIKGTTDRTIIIENGSKRTVLIEFFSDPDVRITEKLETKMRPLVSIEIKGGTDISNIHNRLGESEKSHQKAKNRGFFEFWTITRVDIDQTAAKRESPTTSHLFHLDRIQDTTTKEYKEFKELLSSLIGIRSFP
ncbi:MAG: XcyI family restriction endonuclease [Deltaproteobacteria bacterium]|nr:XcyI family restriction endonuclease [Deltaproteobacteria bacterium]